MSSRASSCKIVPRVSFNSARSSAMMAAVSSSLGPSPHCLGATERARPLGRGAASEVRLAGRRPCPPPVDARVDAPLPAEDRDETRVDEASPDVASVVVASDMMHSQISGGEKGRAWILERIEMAQMLLSFRCRTYANSRICGIRFGKLAWKLVSVAPRPIVVGLLQFEYTTAPPMAERQCATCDTLTQQVDIDHGRT